jgi:hypothetical protein
MVRDWSRREFIRVAGALAGLAAVPGLGACGDDLQMPRPGSSQLPTLGGAPDTYEGHVIAAFCDTVIPGKYRDPKGAPGAIDTGAPALFFDPSLPALPYVGLLVLALDSYARKVVVGAAFVDLTPDQREEALVQAIMGLDLIDFAIELAKLAHFSSKEAGLALGYPGANPGYVTDKDFSFKRSLAREITSDGNYP